jgi:hypothetical protein
VRTGQRAQDHIAHLRGGIAASKAVNENAPDAQQLAEVLFLDRGLRRRSDRARRRIVGGCQQQ